MAITTNALDGLLYIRNGNITARWNFPDALGSSLTSPSGIGNAVTVTYSFLSAAPSYISVTGFLGFDSAQQQATRDVLAAVQNVANIDFIEAGGVAQMTFAMSSQPTGTGGYAYTPGYSYSYSGSTITSVSEQSVAGDVWLNSNATWEVNAWQPGYDGYVTLLHEIGHALGLKHPFDSGTNGFTLADSLDDESHTVMSYTMAPHSRVIEVSGTSTSYSWQETFIRPSTLMPLDIEALQYLYGANTSTRAGDDVYQWPQNAELLETIWDGGGIDTIDCSNQIFTCIIDLRAGAYSSIALRQTDAEIRQGLELPSWFTQVLPADTYNGSSNLAIAAKVIIENAIGGAANDQITGSAANNSLLGGGGVDRLSGNGGSDTLNGGTGADTMLGGTGNDIYVVDNAGDMVTELSAQGVDLVKADITYTLSTNVEKLTLTGTTAINGTGNALNNVLTGNSAANRLAGLAGPDTLHGAAGNDILLGGGGNDILTGGLGKDLFVFNAALNASANIDTLKDYSAAADTIRLENAIFTSLTTTGVLSADNFVQGTAAADANDFLLYDNSTGALYYDVDANAGSAAVQFATVYAAGTTPASLSAAEFVVI